MMIAVASDRDGTPLEFARIELGHSMRLLVTDFDGTIAKIVADVTEPRIDDDARRVLLEAASRDDVVAAIVSGRDVRDVLARTSGLRVYRAGSHGLELMSPDGELLVERPPVVFALPDDLAAMIARDRLLLERKRHGVALHWRASATEPVETIARFRAWAREEELVLLNGRKVAEARVAGPLKRDCIAALASRVGATDIFFSGDDLTDFPSLEFVATCGAAVLVASDERLERPDGPVRVVNDVGGLVGEMVEWLGGVA